MEYTINKFNKKHTKIAKGVAIWLMLIHHLFAFPNWIIEGEYISILKIGQYNIEYLIGDFGKICVGMYLFLSGYGMYKTYENKRIVYRDIICRVTKFFLNYCIVFFIFIPIGYIFFKQKYVFNTQEFFMNLFMLKSTYNTNWWFVSVYVILILSFPLIKNITTKHSVINSMFIIISIHIVYYFTYTIDNLIPEFAILQENILYQNIIMALAYQINFSIGCMFARLNIFEKIKLKKYKINNKIIFSIAIIALFIFRIYIKQTFVYKMALNNIVTIDSILAPILIYLSSNIIINSKIEKIFTISGEHSTNIWLVHGFLCIYYFQKIIYYPRNSILVLLWLIISYIINTLYSLILTNLDKKIINRIEYKI